MAPRWQPGSEVVTGRLDDKVILVNLRTNKIFALNRTSARFWDLLEAGNDWGGMRAALLTEFDVPEEQLDRELEALLASLAREGFVSDARRSSVLAYAERAVRNRLLPRASGAQRQPNIVSLLARMSVWSLTLPVLKHVMPLPTLVSLMSRSSSVVRSAETERQIVAWARRFYRLRNPGTCLERSLLAYRFLSAANADPCLVVGVGTGEVDVLGHAWVLVDGSPLYESSASLEEFVPVVQFAADGRATSAAAGAGPRFHRSQGPEMDLRAADWRRTVGATLAIDAITATVVSALRGRGGVQPLLLRGPAIVRWLYPPGDARGYADIDLLVSPEAFSAAQEVLTELQFVRSALEPELPGDRPRHADTWYREESGIMVDLHRTLPGVGARPAELWAELARQSESMIVGTAEVDVPAPLGRTLVVVLNAAQHGIDAPQSLADLRLALAQLPESLWREAQALAYRLEAEAAFAAGLRLLPEGKRLADRLGLPFHRSVTAELKAQSAPESALALDWILREAGVGTGARLLARKAVPSAEFMRAWSPLARRGPLGMAAAYAWRPVWLVGQSVPAFRAWRRAQRVAR